MSHSNGEDRSYDRAIRILNSRVRVARPQQVETSSSGRNAAAYGQTTNPTPGSRGTPGIKGMSLWLDALGHSEQQINGLNVVHIAGTKGKGSTCAFTEAFLRARGRRTGFPKKTGLYTSPHLITPRERIRINSEPISEILFAKYFFEVFDRLPVLADDFDPTKEIEARGPGYLQLFALLAFHVFVREDVDVTVLETHCGGEYDATNVVQRPIVTAVTTLGMDHIAMLGPTIENIAWHKGGIYKSGAVALSAPQDPVPAKVLMERSKEKGQQVKFVESENDLPSEIQSLNPNVQRINASVAAAAARSFLERCAPQVHESLTSEDLKAALEHFSWPGRFQKIREQEWTWCLDAAHNDMSVKVAAEWFEQTYKERQRHSSEPCILIFSHINELRDSVELFKSLGQALKLHGVHIEHVILSTYDESANLESHTSIKDSEEFKAVWAQMYPSSGIWSEPTIQGAISLARQLGPDGMHTLITGSQHLVGPSLRILGWSPSANV